jgi:hypothetical protein
MNLYVSLTSIFQNQHTLLNTLISVKQQQMIPTKVFLYLSEEPYLLDTGFKNKVVTNKDLQTFLSSNQHLIEVVWTENTGPYRKLLPLLKEKWEEDCLIVTIDDDTEYLDSLLLNLVKDYNEQKCLICYRGYTLNFKIIENITYTNRIPLINRYLYNLPTGKGGILYHPSFFKGTGDLIFSKDIYTEVSKTTDDLWFYMIRICNKVDCYMPKKAWQKKDNTTQHGLYGNFNSKNDTNTKNLKKIIRVLQVKKYLL